MNTIKMLTIKSHQFTESKKEALKCLQRDSDLVYCLRAMAKPKKTMQLNKPASFRPPNSKFVVMCNHAMTATQLSINEICVAAIEMGLPLAVPKLLEAKQKEEANRRFAEEEFRRLIDVTGEAYTALIAGAEQVTQKSEASGPSGKGPSPKRRARKR